MAKLTLNSALNGIRGRIDNWVYRQYGSRVILSRRPETSGVVSPAQTVVRERFKAAAAYARIALADPVQQPRYQAAARAKGMALFAFVVGDFLNPPVVQAIDATAYHGVAGDPIKVSATDDFEVVSVSVAIRDAAGAVLEQGPAVLVDGKWTYAATVAATAGETVTIEATAKGRPGNPGSLALPWLIA
jgi:hypothetical protein